MKVMLRLCEEHTEKFQSSRPICESRYNNYFVPYDHLWIYVDIIMLSYYILTVFLSWHRLELGDVMSTKLASDDVYSDGQWH